jgi:hypothetical protein
MKYKVILVLLFGVYSCAPTRFIEPLEEGQHAASFSLGGSLIDYNNTTIAVPLTSVSYAYGLKKNTSLWTSLHTTSLLFNTLQLDLGGLYQIKSQEGFLPGISKSLQFNYVTELSDGNAKFWPQIDGNAFWKIYDKHRIHLGYSIWIDTQMLDEQKIALIHPHLGYSYQKKQWDLGMELKLLAPSYDNTKVFLPYQSILGDKGATGLYFFITKRF